MVYLKIKSAPPNSVIILPERHIVLPGLSFSHPLTIIGNAATTLEIVNGNLLVDFRDYKNTLTAEQKSKNPYMKVLIQETTIIFKVNIQRMKERFEEYQNKFSQLKVEKKIDGAGRFEWNEQKPLLGDDISIDESYEDYNHMPYSMRGLRYISMNKGILTMPMIAIENDSIFEMRDCMVRSSRTAEVGSGLDGKSQERSEWTLKQRSNSFMDEKRD